MKYLKRIGTVLGLIVIGGIAGLAALFYVYSGYAPKDDFRVDRENLGFFREDYNEARALFRQEVSRLTPEYPGSRLGSVRVPSKIDPILFFDYGFFRGKDGGKLLILSSGVHGTEGFLGSALQQVFIDEYLEHAIGNGIDVLMIHGLNPYGFKYNRRVTENNVDLNRNCHVDEQLFDADNPGYERIRSYINPEEPVDLDRGYHRNFVFLALRMIARHGMEVLRQAILSGQYDYPESVYYGGRAFEPQIMAVRELIDSLATPYSTLMAIDIHTGYGERGKMHLFLNPVSPQIEQNIRQVFADFEIDWGQKETFYTVTGSFTDFVGMIHADKEYIPMLFEFGTMNSQTTLGSLKSLQYTIQENQGNHFGYASPEDSLRVQDQFRNMFYPDSPGWKSNCVDEFREVMDVAMVRFGAFR
jgi:hypothetical protein